MWNTWNDALQPWLFGMPLGAAPARPAPERWPGVRADWPPRRREARPPHERGGFFERTYLIQCGTRRYKLFVPPGPARQGLPLVVMLHGCSQSADEFALATQMNALAERQPCFVLYPEQSSSANCARCWNWFQANDQQRDQGEPGILAGMTEQVIAEFGIDGARVFVAGHSAGGAMAVILGQTYPELFRAVGCHSGMPYAAASDAASAMSAMRHGVRAGAARTTVPVIVFHGDCDTTVHPSNGAGIVAQSLGGAATDAGIDAREAVYRGHETGSSYTRKVHHGPGGRPVAEEWTIHGTGHGWSGGSHRGTYADSRGPDAAAEMLRFFLSTALGAPYRQLPASGTAAGLRWGALA